MAQKAATLGDPKRPQEAKKLTPELAASLCSPDETLSASMLLGCVGVVAVAMFTQSKPLVWVAVALLLSAYSHLPYDANDALRLVTFALTMVMWAFAQLYVMRPSAAARSQTGS